MSVTSMTSHETNEADELWAMEEAYWEYLSKEEWSAWSSLWHEDVITWPDGLPEPLNKAGVIDSMTGLVAASQVNATSFERRRRSVRVQGKTGITYYDLHVKGKTKDGQDIDVHQRITHTWVWPGAGWQIVGGMSAP